jgi:hypothetical protein
MVCFWYNFIDLHMSVRAHLILKFLFRVEFFDFPGSGFIARNYKKKIYLKIFLKLNVNVKHTLHYEMHTVMEGGGVSNLQVL